MSRLNRFPWQPIFLVGLIFSAVSLTAESKRPMPTAQLPIEPASSDADFLSDGQGGDRSEMELPVQTSAPHHPRQNPTPLPVVQVASFAREWVVQGGLQMTPSGFGAQWRLLQYATPWASMTESLRYFASEKTSALFRQQYGLMLGLELHPWRRARVSPLWNLQAGVDHFTRENLLRDDAAFGIESSVGLELQMARVSSVIFQWVETYYPDLRQPLYAEQKANTKRQGSFQVFFNLRWSSVL